jgi:hypothetical protein
MFSMTSVTALSEERSIKRCLHGRTVRRTVRVGSAVRRGRGSNKKSRKNCHTLGQSDGSSDELSVPENQTYSIFSDRCSNKSFHTAGLPVGNVGLSSCEGFA